MAHIRRYNPLWGSHIPVLVKLLDITSGPVLELGMGAFSTPLLHSLCQNKDRLLVSYEEGDNYFAMHKPFESPLHQLVHIMAPEDWGKTKIEDTPWDVAFIDHCADRRAADAARLANIAKYVVIHDSDPSNDKYYHYPEIYPLFKYRYDYTKLVPNTTVLSNFVDVTGLKI